MSATSTPTEPSLHFKRKMGDCGDLETTAGDEQLPVIKKQRCDEKEEDDEDEFRAEDDGDDDDDSDDALSSQSSIDPDTADFIDAYLPSTAAHTLPRIRHSDGPPEVAAALSQYKWHDSAHYIDHNYSPRCQEDGAEVLYTERYPLAKAGWLRILSNWNVVATRQRIAELAERRAREMEMAREREWEKAAREASTAEAEESSKLLELGNRLARAGLFVMPKTGSQAASEHVNGTSAGRGGMPATSGAEPTEEEQKAKARYIKELVEAEREFWINLNAHEAAAKQKADQEARAVQLNVARLMDRVASDLDMWGASEELTRWTVGEPDYDAWDDDVFDAQFKITAVEADFGTRADGGNLADEDDE